MHTAAGVRSEAAAAILILGGPSGGVRGAGIQGGKESHVMWDLVVHHWAVVLVLVILFLALLLGRVLLPEPGMPYEKRPSLVTDAERAFFAILCDVVDQRWRVFAMVRLADVIRVRRAAPQHLSWQNRILAKHVDFVLCDANTLEAVLAVELDDASHQRADRATRDAFLEEALEASKLPLLRVPVASSYDRDALRKTIEELVA
jgi:very-short-patch-repair endonuclease